MTRRHFLSTWWTDGQIHSSEKGLGSTGVARFYWWISETIIIQGVRVLTNKPVNWTGAHHHSPGTEFAWNANTCQKSDINSDRRPVTPLWWMDPWKLGLDLSTIIVNYWPQLAFPNLSILKMTRDYSVYSSNSISTSISQENRKKIERAS